MGPRPKHQDESEMKEREMKEKARENEIKFLDNNPAAR
jgi:hypothetical protein